MTALAFQNAAMLRRLASTTDPVLTVGGLAADLARDPSNTRRALKGLQGEGLVAEFALTEAGQRILIAIDMAEGRDDIGAQVASARGASDSAPISVWPLDRIVRNPANRRIDPASIPGMADSLAAQGQLQPITLTPVREDGNRMLLIGERRWLGAVMAAEQGRLPDSLADGLRFEEREATPAEALAITLIENSERQDIPPLEEAFLLRDLADALDMTALAVAEHLGRKPRDVQDKIRIARNASPEALTAYAEDGSWDRLRDSIPTTRKPGSLAGEIEELAQAEADREAAPFQWTTHDVHRTPFADVDGQTEPMLSIWVMTDGGDRFTVDWIANVIGERVKHTGGETLPNAGLALERAIDAIRRRFSLSLPRPAREWLDALQGPFVVDGVDCFNASNAGERRKAIGWDPRQSNSGGGQGQPAAAAEPALPLPEGDQPGLSGGARLALIEIAHKTAEHPRPISPTDTPEWTGDPDRDFAAFGAAGGKFWLDSAFNELQGLRLVRAVMQTDQPPIIILTPEGVAWFGANDVALPVTEQAVSEAQGGFLIEGAYVTPWLEQEGAPAAGAPSPAPAPTETADLYDRTPDQIAADADLRARCEAFAGQQQATHDGADFRSLWDELGLDPEVVISQAGGGILANPSDGSNPLEILTADAGGSMPDERAHAVAWLAAWAIEQALGGPTAKATNDAGRV